MSDYWLETIESSLDEAGIAASKEQIQMIAGDCEVSEENHHMVTGPPIEIGYDPVKAIKKEHATKMGEQQRVFDRIRESMDQNHRSDCWRLRSIIAELKEEVVRVRRSS